MATVLVVDDDNEVRNLAGFILQQKGHDILSASNGVEGLFVYSSYRHKIDLVLTDIEMPQMSGIELAARIRDRDPQKIILLMSGRPRQPAFEAYPFLSKPFSPDQLIAVVNCLLK